MNFNAMEIDNIALSYTNVISKYIDKIRKLYNISEKNNIKIKKIKYINKNKYEIEILTYSNFRKEYELSTIIEKYSLLNKLQDKIIELLDLDTQYIENIKTLFIVDDVQLTLYSNKLLISIIIAVDHMGVLSQSMQLGTLPENNILSLKKDITNMYILKPYPNIYSLLKMTSHLRYKNILHNYDGFEYIEAIKSYNKIKNKNNLVSVWISENKNNVYIESLFKYNIKYFLPSYDEYTTIEDERKDRKNIDVFWDLIFRLLLISKNKDEVNISNTVINDMIYSNIKNELYMANISPTLINRLYYYDKSINKNKNKYSMKNYVDSFNMREKIFNHNFIYVGSYHYDSKKTLKEMNYNIRYNDDELEQLFGPMKEDMNLIQMNEMDNKKLYIDLLENMEHNVPYKVFYIDFFINTIQNDVDIEDISILNDNTEILYSYISLPKDNINNHTFLLLTKHIMEKIYYENNDIYALRSGAPIINYTSLYYCILATLSEYTIDNVYILVSILNMMDDSVYLLGKGSSVYSTSIFGRLISDYVNKEEEDKESLFYILNIINDIVKDVKVKEYILKLIKIIN
uniref:Uncharacterized protein n=1 Tax=Pithovirus LCPAC101 TaxID=2506586 RepID=A0A481Z484_9VIRU|nr:MAG: hypothetical protein LCPAC101_00920 [Pithovirus LCPAC101]